MQPDLPYDPTQPQWPFQQVDMTRAPAFIPPYQCEQEFQGWVGYATNLAMAHLQSAAQRNAPRMFTYNQFTRPGNLYDPNTRWQNFDFLMLVGKIMDHTVLSLVHDRRENFPDPASAIQVISERIVDLMVGVAVTETPALQRYVDQEMFNQAMAQATYWQRLNEQLKNFRMRVQIFGYGPQMQQQFNQQPGSPFPQHQQQFQPGAGTVNALGLAVGVATQSLGHQVPGHDTSFVHQRVNHEQQESPYARMKREKLEAQQAHQQRAAPVIDVLAQPFHPRKEEPVVMDVSYTPAVAQTLDDGSVLIPEALSKHSWKPTEIQPYRPAYRPSSEMRMHRIFPDGTVFVEVHSINENMDYEKHNLPNVFGRKRDNVPYDVARANEALSRGAQEFSERMKWSTEAQRLGETTEGQQAQDKANEEPVSVIVIDEWRVDWSEVNIMLSTGIRKLQKAAELGKSPDVFRMYGYVTEGILCQQDESKLFDELADSRTYAELAEKLKTAVKDGHDLGLIETVTRRAIVLLNRVLSLKLSIPPGDCSLGTDFDPETIYELEGVLNTEYGSQVVAAYRSGQRNSIESIFQSIESPEIEQELRGGVLDTSKFPEGKAPWLGLATCAYSFTMLDMYSHDLDLNLDADTGSQLQQEKAPDLFVILADLFARLPADKTFYRHLFQTLDGVVLEITQGAIGLEAYMVSRSPQLWFSA